MNLLKKATTVILVLAVFIPTFCGRVMAVETSAGAAVVIDGQTGRVLYEKNAHTRLGMASTTKIMTAIIALEKGDLSDVVTVDKRAEGIEGSSLYLRGGDKITLKNLLYGMLLRSGNDAATAVALHFCDSVDEFAVLMTDKAKQLGLENTQFKNPHGLHQEGHYTSAYDLAQITRYGFSLPGFAEMVNCKTYTIDDNIESKVVTNNNKLLQFYDGADGVKTGYTPETGRTLVGSATRGGMRVIAVTLNDRDDWNDHMAMFDYAFENYERRTLTEKNKGYGCVPVKDGVDSDVPILAAEKVSATVLKNGEITMEVKAEKSLKAPVKKGQRAGKVIFKENGKVIGETELVCGCGMEKEKKPGFFRRIINWIMRK